MNTEKNIAVIDDDEIFVFIITKLLKQVNSPTKLEVFNNGNSILEFLRSHSDDVSQLPDIILLDITMPVMDGWQFLEEYNQLILKLDKPISIYVTTSSITPEDIEKAKSFNVITDFLIKPLTLETISTIVEKDSFA